MFVLGTGELGSLTCKTAQQANRLHGATAVCSALPQSLFFTLSRCCSPFSLPSCLKASLLPHDHSARLTTKPLQNQSISLGANTPPVKLNITFMGSSQGAISEACCQVKTAITSVGKGHLDVVTMGGTNSCQHMLMLSPTKCSPAELWARPQLTWLLSSRL